MYITIDSRENAYKGEQYPASVLYEPSYGVPRTSMAKQHGIPKRRT